MADSIIQSYPVFHVTGAIHSYVRTPLSAQSGNDTYYLGAHLSDLDGRLYFARAEVKNSRAGVALPAQKTRQGQKADIVLPLTYYSEPALQAMLAPSGSDTAAGAVNNLNVRRGWEGRFSRGALADGLDTFELWLVYERQTNANTRNATLPIGMYFPLVELLKHSPEKCGPQETVMMVMLEARPKWIPQASYTTVADNERTHFLYADPLPTDSDVATYFPTAVRVPQ
jgi:hypothetical protein